MFLIRTGLLLISALVIAAGYYFGRVISLGDQWSYFEALRTTSAIVFGVMGALLAIVYPEVVKQGFRNTKNTNINSPENLMQIVDPLAHSAVLLVILILVSPLFAWLRATFVMPVEPLIPSSSTIRVQGGAFAILCLLSIWQIWILVKVLLPLDTLRSHTALTKAKMASRKKIHTNGNDQ